MDADTIIAALQQELQRHTFDTFMDEPPSIVRGSKGVVVSGCPACKKRPQSVAQFMHHLLEDMLPTTIRKSFESAQKHGILNRVRHFRRRFAVVAVCSIVRQQR